VDVALMPSVAEYLTLLAAHASPAGPAPPWVAWAGVVSEAGVRNAYLVLALCAFGGAIWLVRFLRQGTPGTSATGDATYGSARWRTGRELLRGLSRWNAGARANPVGLVVGAAKGGREVSSAFVVSQDGHNLVLGAPGAGKSTLVIEPTLSVIARGGESAVVTDPKGELYEETAGLFLRQGYGVHRFDLREPGLSVRWNALETVARALSRGDATRATRHARDLAQILTGQAAPQGEGGAFWRESAVALVTALVLAVAERAEPASRNLGSVYRALVETDDLDAFFATLPLGHPAVRAYGAVKLSGKETRQSQLAVTAVALSLFGDPSIAWLTSASEFDPASVGRSPTAVFVVVPDDTAAYYPLATLFVSQILQALAGEASGRSGGRLPVPVHFVLDEFGSFPRIPDFEKALAVARGRGIRISLVLQAFSQLDAQYGSEIAKVMRNVCNTWVYLSSNDVQTGRLVSDKAGQSTVATTSRSRALGYQGQQSPNETVAATSRALLTVDEVLRWPFGQSLVLQSGQLPARLPLRPFREWPGAGTPAPRLEERVVSAPTTWAPTATPKRSSAPAVEDEDFPEGLLLEEPDGLEFDR
jgi:type IV secretion system protein VirD4